MAALIEEGLLRNEATLGVARQLAGTGDIDGLTARQRSVYANHIQPRLRIPCANKACAFGGDIEDHLMADAIRNGRNDAQCALCLSLSAAAEKDD
ncbi:MAG: hypothetical protein KUL86_09675 [Castellaniella sp.]|nr:hypothetical protein [Castellaniella sp.]